MIELEKKESIYHLNMNAGENRWNTTFVRQFAEALDEIEKDEGPGALVTSSKDPKFFSNGLDLDWMQDPEGHPEGGDREVFGEEFMHLMGRIITRQPIIGNFIWPRIVFCHIMSLNFYISKPLPCSSFSFLSK